ncbi:hypothetical protein JZO70_07780 [Enterococcus sp. 669A]|uniref:Lipoprotein n=1 Tax=Candidatus Enterococcus moelleringii TaxID=2815325 RepID=A0ABS3L8U5_9ENTE|nr:hypothetical protein [Enterococcus sp. 669A]MBO1306056.1 hypothetical protein [Enterococcus sp. 669A]
MTRSRKNFKAIFHHSLFVPILLLFSCLFLITGCNSTNNETNPESRTESHSEFESRGQLNAELDDLLAQRKKEKTSNDYKFIEAIKLEEDDTLAVTVASQFAVFRSNGDRRNILHTAQDLALPLIADYLKLSSGDQSQGIPTKIYLQDKLYGESLEEDNAEFEWHIFNVSEETDTSN